MRRLPPMVQASGLVVVLCLTGSALGRRGATADAAQRASDNLHALCVVLCRRELGAGSRAICHAPAMTAACILPVGQGCWGRGPQLVRLLHG
jgi:hypothetical protein